MNSIIISPFEQAQEQLFAPTAITLNDLSDTLNKVMAYSADFADVYLETRQTESWSLESGIVRSGNFASDQGFGLRAVREDETAFAFSQQITRERLLDAASAVRAIARQGQSASTRVSPQSPSLYRRHYGTIDPTSASSAKEKIALLERIDQIARGCDQAVREVGASLQCEYTTTLVLRHDGRLAADILPMLHLSIFVLVQRGEHIESANGGLGGRFGLKEVSDVAIERMVRNTVNEAITKLDAEHAPSGEMTVVIGPGWPGMLLHEAVGHGLEGDFNRQGSSIYSGRIGEQVAAAGVTIVDNGTLPGNCGSINIDDEGELAQETILIENGILQGYMQDSLNARLMGVAPTGNGRRQSYAYLPMPRMTNTYMCAGDYVPDEIIASVKSGLYLANLGSGQVDIVSGRFTFQSALAYRIENGKLTVPVKGATLTGEGPLTMQRISMVGNDLQLDPGVASCGKSGQEIPVCVGQPTLKVDNLLVGGTQ